jgi:hypothetical protein
MTKTTSRERGRGRAERQRFIKELHQGVALSNAMPCSLAPIHQLDVKRATADPPLATQALG